MSYCRMGWDSDVYVLRGVDGVLECVDCRASGSRGYFSCRTEAAMITHLEVHRAAGQRVPERALERLHREVLGGGGR